ncbi:MAG TPA: endonuclease [Sedimenticola thiotaurini]|uniref:Endonuclease n=1 Tax=Sedimenticola thiotaurini TaxID=1543721 RepID=A0A831WAB5_9GAMM|nr:endonuclease [Sedimenticola thiotaurini]
MTGKLHLIRIGDHYYPRPDRGWGSCAEELLHHSSRYYHYTEAFLRNLAGDRRFVLGGYRAEDLSEAQRGVLAAVLSLPPGAETAAACIRIVEAVCAGRDDVDADLAERYRERLHVVPREEGAPVEHSFHDPVPPRDLPPIEPFLAIAERLQMPVAVHGHVVELSFRQLARHLDSPRPQVRVNLQNAILWLHQAGYHLHDHPGLSHGEARDIGDDGAV